MNTRRFCLLAGIVWAGSLTRLESHSYPIEPVNVELFLDGSALRATIDSNGAYWADIVLQEEDPPGTNWSADLKARAKSYLDARFVLRADGKPLESLLVDAGFRKEPWQLGTQSRIHFELRYALPGSPQKIQGRTNFFVEYRKSVSANDVHASGEEVPADFRTILRLTGAQTTVIELPLEHPDFEFAVADLKIDGFQRHLSQWRRKAVSRLRQWTPLLVAFGIGILFWSLRDKF